MDNQVHWEPQRLDQFIGQEAILRQLRIEIKASQQQRRPLRSQLWSGPPGLGKTALARILAAERGSPVVESMGKSLTHRAISEVLCSMESPGYDREGHLVDPEKAVFPIWVVDECQKTDRESLNLMHPAMTPGPDGRRLFMARTLKNEVVQAWCIHHTVIFITNFAGEFVNLSPATASRLPMQQRFDWYTDEEIVKMIFQFVSNFNWQIDEEAARLIAERSNGFPRTAIDNLLPRAYDFATVNGSNQITLQTVQDLLDSMGIDEHGLDRTMRAYLAALASTPSGAMSIRSLAGVLDTDTTTLTTCIEPVLLRRRLITLGCSGRQISQEGRTMLSGNVAMADNIYSHTILK